MFRKIGELLDSWLPRIPFHKKKIILPCLVFAVFLYIYYKSQSMFEYSDIFQSFKDFQNFKFMNIEKIPEKLTKTPNILDYEPTERNSIFLLNTSDVSKGIELTARQACCIESAGRSLTLNYIFIDFRAKMGIHRVFLVFLPRTLSKLKYFSL